VDGVYQSGYGAFTGTSMATPHVTGAALMFKSLHPNANAAQIKAGILGAAVATPSLDGKVLTNGRLDVSRF
jgi:subtilisin family serine protease